jgi:hypothetical protein
MLLREQQQQSEEFEQRLQHQGEQYQAQLQDLMSQHCLQLQQQQQLEVDKKNEGEQACTHCENTPPASASGIAQSCGSTSTGHGERSSSNAGSSSCGGSAAEGSSGSGGGAGGLGVPGSTEAQRLHVELAQAHALHQRLQQDYQELETAFKESERQKREAAARYAFFLLDQVRGLVRVGGWWVKLM